MLQQLLRRRPFHRVHVQTLPKEVYQFLIQRVILKPRLELLLETPHKAFDFLDNLIIVPPCRCEKSCREHCFALMHFFALEGHPNGDPNKRFQNIDPETPHVNAPRQALLFQELILLFIIDILSSTK